MHNTFDVVVVNGHIGGENDGNSGYSYQNVHVMPELKHIYFCDTRLCNLVVWAADIRFHKCV